MLLLIPFASGSNALTSHYIELHCANRSSYHQRRQAFSIPILRERKPENLIYTAQGHSTKYKARNLSQIGTILKLTTCPFYLPIHKGMQANIFLPQGIISLVLCNCQSYQIKGKDTQLNLKLRKFLVCVCPVMSFIWTTLLLPHTTKQVTRYFNKQNFKMGF